jgi:hypothetical protein
MTSHSFLPVPGATVMFDIVQGASVAGFVWQRADRWYASDINTADPSINEATREAAAEELLVRLSKRTTPVSTLAPAGI